MKVLWITNIVFPEARKVLSGNAGLKASGGWMIGSMESLFEYDKDICIYVATISTEVKELTKINGLRAVYYIIPLKKQSFINKCWKEIQNEVSPDVIHIHGTECNYGLSYINSCTSKNVVLSIQGMISECYKYYYAGISVFSIIRSMTFRDMLLGGMIKSRCDFRKNGKREAEIISKVGHIIGRTSWDKAHALMLNPSANYYFCNETLRHEFYDCKKWSYANCKKHSIFVSQANYSLKGFHILLRAIPLVMRDFPDTKVVVAGRNIVQNEGLSGFIQYTGYGSYISKLIKELHLEKQIEFVGNLDANEMIEKYLHCNVFVSPSSIENSPNSVCEAQLLGTPVVASYVGGVTDLMKGVETNLYRYDDYCMLAKNICDVFNDGDKQPEMISTARLRHDKMKNAKALMNIYLSISNCNKA